MSEEGERKVLPYRRATRGGCPSCGKPAAARWRPFCSKRCADLDLHRWLSEGYRIPTDEPPPETLDGDATPREES